MAKNILPKLILPLLLLLLSGLPKLSAGLRAQDSLAFTPVGLSGLPDTAYAGDTASFAGFVINNSSILFYDTMSIYGYVDTGGVNIPFVIPQFQPSYINPGDSILIISAIEFRSVSNGGYFKIGNNTIVIWPARANTSGGPIDSMVLHILVVDTLSSVDPIDPDKFEVRCYPVPGNGPLYITSSNQNLRPIAAIIHDSQGRVVHVADDLSDGIITQFLLPGVYYVEVFFDNDQRRTYKVIRP